MSLKLCFAPSVVAVNRILRQVFGPSRFIDLEKLICNYQNQTCNIFTPDSEVMFFDFLHLSKRGACHMGNLVFTQHFAEQLL